MGAGLIVLTVIGQQNTTAPAFILYRLIGKTFLLRRVKDLPGLLCAPGRLQSFDGIDRVSGFYFVDVSAGCSKNALCCTNMAR